MMLGSAYEPIILNIEKELNNFSIKNPYPNPFNPTVNFDISLLNDSKVSIQVYNIKGQKIDYIFIGNLSLGKHTFNWTALTESSGVYFLQILLDNNNPIIKKIVLIK